MTLAEDISLIDCELADLAAVLINFSEPDKARALLKQIKDKKAQLVGAGK